MTMKTPRLSLADKLLKILGKKRGVIVASDQNNKFKHYSISLARKESFLKALMRPKKEALPDGMIDIISFYKK